MYDYVADRTLCEEGVWWYFLDFYRISGHVKPMRLQV